MDNQSQLAKEGLFKHFDDLKLSKECWEPIYKRCLEIIQHPENQKWNLYDGKARTNLNQKDQCSLSTHYHDVTLYQDDNYEVFFVNYTGYFDYPFHYHNQPEHYIHLKGYMDMHLKFQEVYDKHHILEKSFDRVDIYNNYKHAMIVPQGFMGLSIWNVLQHKFKGLGDVKFDDTI